MNELNKSAFKTASYTIPSFYSSYLSSIEPDTVYDIDYTTYRKIITEYFQYLRDQIIEESKRVKLPYRMGSLQIIKKQPKHLDGRSLRIDYQATKEYGKLIYLLNEHSNGYKYRLYWDKQDLLVKNKSKYQIQLSRANKRNLASIIKNKVHDYEEI